MAKKEFPKCASNVSMALTPMTLTARMIRREHPDAKIVFVGPCSAKKLEAMRKSVRSEVDFVLTFEEVAGMMEAKHIDYASLEDDNNSDFNVASHNGRAFAISGGVAAAVKNVIQSEHPEMEVAVQTADGLEECRSLMKAATKGKYDGYLLDGYQVYNPKAVVSVMTKGRFRSYWSETGSYEVVVPLICMNYDGLRNAIIEMLSGSEVKVDTATFKNDPAKIQNRDDVITYLIHLGYLGYNEDSESAFVPNEEIRQELITAVRSFLDSC